MSDQSELADYLANHPRMIGIVFTMFLLLSQAGNVSAAWGTTTGGP